VVERIPHLAFGSPRALPRASSLVGRVVVLDVAFAASSGASVSFDQVTLPFIRELGDRLAAWVDHHDHERHVDFASDPRFFLATKAEHGACPEMVTPEIVRQAGPIDTILCHLDLDGLYAAAKWIRGGIEPYRGADDDARAVDTRTGKPGPIATSIDRALRARFRDEDLKRRIIAWLVAGTPRGPLAETIAEAAAEFDARDRGTRALVRRFAVRGAVAYVDASGSAVPYDKTDLLLAGQALAEVAIVRDSGHLTIAAAYDSGWDFVALLGLEGGMPTRVTVPDGRMDDVMARIEGAARSRVLPGD
jgi:hypothetical protein